VMILLKVPSSVTAWKRNQRKAGDSINTVVRHQVTESTPFWRPRSGSG
jgi:hypothetical protein